MKKFLTPEKETELIGWFSLFEQNCGFRLANSTFLHFFREGDDILFTDPDGNGDFGIIKDFKKGLIIQNMDTTYFRSVIRDNAFNIVDFMLGIKKRNPMNDPRSELVIARDISICNYIKSLPISNKCIKTASILEIRKINHNSLECNFRGNTGHVVTIVQEENKLRIISGAMAKVVWETPMVGWRQAVLNEFAARGGFTIKNSNQEELFYQDDGVNILVSK